MLQVKGLTSSALHPLRCESMETIDANKSLLERVFAELACGNSAPFVDAMSDEFAWTIGGTTPWSKTYAGKSAVVGELFAGLRARLVPPIRTTAHCFIADGDHVVVQARGENVTVEGVRYNNVYCYVFRVASGKLAEMTEYLDTELARTALGDPPASR